jgi:predicted nucleotidyltransferase component of viral defense system
MVALLDDKFLSGQMAMRGGTLFHKAHLAAASRYSEDVDLVAVGTGSSPHACYG